MTPAAFFYRANFVRRHWLDRIFRSILVSNSTQAVGSSDPFRFRDLMD